MVLLGMIGGQEIILILIVVLVLFGGKKIPELMKGLGKGVKEYKKAVNGADGETENATKPQETTDNNAVNENATGK